MSNRSQFNCRVWQARCWRDTPVGYLVTEPGNIDRPIALLYADSFHDQSDADRDFETAEQIARDPTAVWRSAGPVVNLSDYGHPDSRSPMPAFIYSLRCVPMPPKDMSGEAPEPINVPPVEPRPYCRFLLAEVKRAAVKANYAAIAAGEGVAHA